jgi:hypothetical protein
MNDILVPISRELLDKITILRIKEARIQDATKLGNVKLSCRCWRRPGRTAARVAADVGVDERAPGRERAAVGHRGLIRDKEARQSFTATSSSSHARFTSAMLNALPQEAHQSGTRFAPDRGEVLQAVPLRTPLQRRSVYSALQ